MTDALPRTHRQPKLRSSCDRCGAAKLKCDRGQPSCGRCIPLGLKCVYGVSRKMGKPPREKLRISRKPSTLNEDAGSIDRERSNDSICSSGTGSVGNGTAHSSGSFPSFTDLPSTWGSVESYPDGLMTSFDVPDASHGDLLGPSLPDIMSLDFSGQLLPTQGSPKFDSYSPPAAQTMASQKPIDECMESKNTLMPLADSKGHDCSQEAHDILSSLSFLKLDKTYSIAQLTQGPPSTTVSNSHRVPFDHILRLNRESSDRLGRLLTCYCAKWPHHALLYSSIISLVLARYEEAAGCTHKASWSPVAAAADTISRHESLSGSQSPWSTTAASMIDIGDPSIPTYTGGTALAVTPTHMAMGSFNIDDQQVQAALRIQLLLGELRRTGSLIDLFRSSSGVDQSTFNGVDGLYKSLSSWLNKEHSRIADVMRSRLKEASI